MGEKNEIDRAHKIGETGRRTRQAQWAVAQGRQNVFHSERRRHRGTGVMPPKGVQPMRVGSSNQWFAKSGCHAFCPAVWIEEPNMKMAVFNGVEQSISASSRDQLSAKHIEWMRRNRKNGVPALRSQLPQIVEVF